MSFFDRYAPGSLVLALAGLMGCGESAGDATVTSGATTGAGGEAAGSSSSSDAASTSAVTTGGGGAGGAGPIMPVCSPDVPRVVPLQAWAEPDAGQAPFVDALSTATSSIRVMVYQMGYGQILDTLKNKAMSGVSVRVILDVSQIDTNQKYFDQLTAAGAEVEWSDPAFSYMHAKALVVDDAIAVISTGNYLATEMAKERNYVARDDDPADVQSLAALFDADWAKVSPDLSCTRLVVSPVNSRDRIVGLVDEAQSTLDIESMQLADTGVRNAVVARKNAGVTVRVLLADAGWIDANTSAAAFLAQHGIEARYLVTPKIHVKAIEIDGSKAYLGSENLSYTSLEKNREVGVIVLESDVLATMSSTFEADWAVATPF